MPLSERLSPYRATRVATMRPSGLWAALSAALTQVGALPPDPISDAEVDRILADEAQRAFFAHLRLLAAAPVV